MTSRRLLTLTIAALLAIGAGVWLAARQSSTGGQDRALLYPELKQQLDAVQLVQIFKASDAPAVEIVRKDKVWSVTQRAGYPADEPKLRKFLLGLAAAEVVEEKTSNPAHYQSLGVEDVKQPDATGVRVELSGAPGAINLIVGKSGTGGGSRYVRRAGEDQSWLIDASLDTSASPHEWLRKDILDVAADRVQSVSITIDKQKPYTASKASRADANFDVTDVPRRRKLSSPSAANSFATALTGLTLADVQPASAFEGAAPNSHATFTTFDGLVVRLDGWSRDDKRYIAVKTSFDPQLAERFKTPAAAAAEKPEDAKAAETKPAAAQHETPNIEEQAKTTTGRVAGWVYEIPSYKYEQIFKPLEELLAAS